MINTQDQYLLKSNNIYVKDIKNLAKGCEILLLEKGEGIKISLTTSEDYSKYDDKEIKSIDCIDFKLLVLEI